MSVHFSPSFRTCAPLAGPGVYCSRSVIFSLSSFSLVLIDPCGRGGVRERLRERTRTDGSCEGGQEAARVICSILLGRSFRNKSSNDMAFPHPKSRKKN